MLARTKVATLVLVGSVALGQRSHAQGLDREEETPLPAPTQDDAAPSASSPSGDREAKPDMSPGDGAIRDPAYASTVVGSRGEPQDETLPIAITTVDLGVEATTGAGLSLGEATLAVPGLVVRNRFNYAQDVRLSVRGFGARSAFGVRGIRVVLDGIPLTQADGLAQVDLVDPELLSRMEVLRGPAGALYGNAAGGVLHLESMPRDPVASSEVLVRRGSFGLTKVVARGVETFSSGAISLAASRLSFKGFREHSNAEQRILLASSRWRLSDKLALRLSLGYVDSPTAEDAGGLTREELEADPLQAGSNNLRFDTGESVVQSQVGAALSWRLSSHETLQGSAFLMNRGFQGRIPFRVLELHLDASGAQLALESHRALGSLPIVARVALEASRLHGRRLSFDNDDGTVSPIASVIQNERVGYLAGYGMVQLKIASWLRALGGARIDLVRVALEDQLLADGDDSGERDFHSPTGMIGLVADLGGHAEVYGNAADSFEVPTVGELSLAPSGGSGLSAELRAQQARNFEVGARYQHQRVHADAAVFYTRLRDELVPFEDETQRTFYRNAGRSHRYGAELAARWRLPGSVQLSLAYTFLRARFDSYSPNNVDLAGNAVPGIAPHRLGGFVHWQRSEAEGPFALATLDYLHGMFADDHNQARSYAQRPVVVKLGYRGAWKVLRYELQGGIDNLLDESYVDNLRVNGVGGRYFEPGAPRFYYMAVVLGHRRPASKAR